jgi:hypothetical protein
MRLLRRIRGIVGTALTWAAGWGALGAVGYSVAVLVSDLPAGEIAGGILFMATFGLLTGGAFSLLALAAERKRTLAHLSLGRVAAWGGLGSTLLIAGLAYGFDLTPAHGSFVLIMGGLAAGSAAGSLAVARRGLIAPPAEMPRVGVAREA